MIYLYYGDDRLAAEQAIDKLLGKDRETIDAADLQPSDLASIFMGTTLFSDQRKILIKDLCQDPVLVEKAAAFTDTPHEIVLLETALDGRKTAIKDLKNDPKIKCQEFKLKAKNDVDPFAVFNVYDLALRNGPAAAKNFKSLEVDPYAALGAWSSKAIKAFTTNPRSAKNRRILKELARIDMLLKGTKFSNSPEAVLESFLLRLKDL